MVSKRTILKERRKRVRDFKRQSGFTGFWFLLPAIILIIVFMLLPVIINVIISATNMSTATGFQNWKWIGFQNYFNIIKHPESLGHFVLTFKYVIATLVFSVAMGLSVALLISHISEKARFFFKVLWLLPMITPIVVYIMICRFIAADAPYGILNQIIIEPLARITQNWISGAPFISIVLVNGFIGASFAVILFTSAIDVIPKELIDAARIDGASLYKRIIHIIIPQLYLPLFFIVNFQTIKLFTSFKEILILTDGSFGTEVWSLWAYKKTMDNYFGNFQWGFGTALATILIVIGFVFSISYLWGPKLKKMKEKKGEKN